MKTLELFLKSIIWEKWSEPEPKFLKSGARAGAGAKIF
jgi:hypothetical protein